MNTALTTLQQLINLLSAQSKAHICIHDFSGILGQAALQLDLAHRIHSRPICSVAKSTARGYRICIRCKTSANNRAVRSGQPFSGYCFYGLYEIARPVVIAGTPRCIIYIGNLVPDPAETNRRIRRMCRLTNVPAERMLDFLPDAETTGSTDLFAQMAALIDSYIQLLSQNGKALPPANPDLHWAVQALKSHAELNYSRNISLESLARLYFMNSKYLGRLFRQQTGLTFHQYLNTVRLDHAEAQLSQTRLSVIRIALDCGFQNVTYFNRVFASRHRIPPLQYRREQTGSEA